MTLYLCTKRSLFHHEDHLIPRISYSRDKYVFGDVNMTQRTVTNPILCVCIFTKVMFTVVCLCPQGWGACARPQPPTLVQGLCLTPLYKVPALAPFPSLYSTPFPTHPPNKFKLVHHEAPTVSKRADGIQLKCLLVE